MHTALWCLAGISLLGAAISAARPAHVKETVAVPPSEVLERVAA